MYDAGPGTMFLETEAVDRCLLVETEAVHRCLQLAVGLKTLPVPKSISYCHEDINCNDPDPIIGVISLSNILYV